MIGGLLQLLVFQGIGELLARFVVPVVPGPVLGLVALLAWLRARGRVGDGLELVAGAFSRHLGLLFVPAAVGVVTFLPQLRGHLPGIVVALLASVVATLAVSGWLLRLLSPSGDDGEGAKNDTGHDRAHERAHAAAHDAAPPARAAPGTAPDAAARQR